MKKSSVNIQEWVESVQTSSTGASMPTADIFNSPQSVKRAPKLTRDMSLQSDDASSHCSSVESVLELRRPDPEAVLIGLGFGPPTRTNTKTRIPPRFLMPSKLLPQIDINKFINEQEGIVPVEQFNSAPASPMHTKNKNC